MKATHAFWTEIIFHNQVDMVSLFSGNSEEDTTETVLCIPEFLKFLKMFTESWRSDVRVVHKTVRISMSTTTMMDMNMTTTTMAMDMGGDMTMMMQVICNI